MGIGKSYVVSKKFCSGDGGLGRIAWMPKSLKEFVKDDFVKLSEELGLGADFIDKIADEDVGFESEAVMAFLEKVGHPALKMDPIA
jgi:acetyl-CoA synthase